MEKLTVEAVLPPHSESELEGVASIARHHCNGVDVRAGLRPQLDLCSHLLVDRQRRSHVHQHSKGLALVVGARDVGDHVCVHLVVGIQHTAAVPLDERGVQQGNLLDL